MNGISGKLFLLSAPSGCGKTTITYKILDALQDTYNISRVITYTTRPPRATDKVGTDYHFISINEFEEKIKNDFFLEWSQAYEHYYGTPGDLLHKIEQGYSYIAVVDIAGIRSILTKYEKAVSIWMEPPSLIALEERLRLRNTENEEQINKRLKLARQELFQMQQTPLYTYKMVNNCLDDTIDSLKKIILSEILEKK